MWRRRAGAWPSGRGDRSAYGHAYTGTNANGYSHGYPHGNRDTRANRYAYACAYRHPFPNADP
jgi:hypothetical protein